MSARDVVVVFVVMVFALSIAVFVTKYTGETITTALKANPGFNSSNQAMAAVTGVEDNGFALLDYFVFTICMGLLLAMIISSWVFPANPILVFAYLLISMIALILAPIFSNVWYNLTSISIFSITLADMPLTNNLLMYLPYYTAFAALISMLVSFGKPYFTSKIT